KERQDLSDEKIQNAGRRGRSARQDFTSAPDQALSAFKREAENRTRPPAWASVLLDHARRVARAAPPKQKGTPDAFAARRILEKVLADPFLGTVIPLVAIVRRLLDSRLESWAAEALQAKTRGAIFCAHLHCVCRLNNWPSPTYVETIALAAAVAIDVPR